MSQLLVLLLLALLIVLNHEGCMVQLTPELAQLVKDNTTPSCFLLLPPFTLHLAKLHRNMLKLGDCDKDIF